MVVNETRLMRAICESLTDGVLVTSSAGTLACNRRLREFFGLDEVTAFDAAHPSVLARVAAPEVFLARWRAIEAAPPERECADAIELLDRRRIERSVAPLVVEGAILGRVWTFHDATTCRLGEPVRSLIDSKMLLADRVLSIGRLAGGLAQELNNPLSFLLSNLDFLASEITALRSGFQPASFAEIQEALADARVGADRVHSIVRLFSSSYDDRRTLVDVEEILGSVLRLLDRDLRSRAKLVRDLKPVPRVLGSTAQLSQVLLSLLMNALDALDETNTRAGEVAVSTRTDARGDVVVEVRDTGAGIPPHLHERIFEPFFAMVSALDGKLELESGRDRGSTFRVVLRAAPEARDSVDASRASILLIDDDPLMGLALRRSLAGDHDVIHVTDGHQALALLDERRSFDLILCDLALPNFDGPEIYAALLERHPEAAARVVFVTGSVLSVSAATYLQLTDRPTLEKPVAMEDLEALIHRVLQLRA